ncbi:hypothetical protein ACFU9F_16870 [Streptomyces zhihengii]|uniref:hypothetical protein n=1 Tax=Streptomyces zhihengii TaxID=1818004 RepID=UPI0036BDD814
MNTRQGYGPDGPEPVAPEEPVVLGALYAVALAGGLLGAGYLYAVAFDDFSESDLMAATAWWFLPVVFGLHGLVSRRLLRRAGAGRPATAGGLPDRGTGPLAALLLFPPLVLRWRRSLPVSLAAVAFWGLLLWIFLTVVFPSL